MCQILIVSKWITNLLWTNFPTIRRQILISIRDHPHYFIFSEYLLQIFVTVCRSTLVYICKLFLCLLYLILILRNLHPASLFHSVNKRLTYCQKDLVLTQWFCFRLKAIWLPSPLLGVSYYFQLWIPLFLDQTEARRAGKNFFRPGCPLISGSGWPPPLPRFVPPLMEGLDPPLIFDRKGLPFVYLLSKKWYPFHMPSYGPCIPFLNPWS